MRDPIATYNERVKAISTFLTSLGIGLIGFAVIRPAIEGSDTETVASVAWGGAGLVMHAIALYILRYLKRNV
ncbi:hypothetical protein [Palleronia rufa]|uniref:hypothetical protein n=1 Tax=Palleronia rufa TaxID=1530186 RepID=UPI00055D7818|nr:hypothetical protein [Palleronia rufa]